MKTKGRKGISLIVLVITIVVIIILASGVILNVTKNNPMENAKIAKLMQEKEMLDSSMQMYISKVMTSTGGEYTTKEILSGEVRGYSSLVKGEELKSEYLNLREADETRIKKELDVILPKTGNSEKIKWYINMSNGIFYRIYETAEEYEKYIGKYDNETEVLENESLSRFVMTKKAMTEKKEENKVTGGKFDGKVNSPVLGEGMTGVYWDENGKEVEVKEENKSNWYNYEENRWANAKTKDGSYWVWIPRYEYKITYYTDSNKKTVSQDVTLYGDIDVKFIPTTQIIPDEGYTYVHPAFRDGSSTHFMNGEWDSEIPGFWVAKYAAGFQASTSSAQNAGQVVNSDDDIVYSDKNYTSYEKDYVQNAISQDLSRLPKMSYPVFKPLTYAYNCISTGDAYTLAREIAKANNFYGLNSSNTDSHMMKNSEWGAVAYLTHSKYGRNGIEVTINSMRYTNDYKSIRAITGYEGYNVAGGVGASSTRNKSGVFDLSGCAQERVAAYIPNGMFSIFKFGSSYANTIGNLNGYQTYSTKYATAYPYVGNYSQSNYFAYKDLKTSIYGYGDAILETSVEEWNLTSEKSWNENSSEYVYENNQFFSRGGYYDNGQLAGIFNFAATSGFPSRISTFRVVLIL